MESELQRKIEAFCAAYIGGPWKNANLDVQRLSGGMSNDVFACSLPGDHNMASDIPKKVIVRFYGEILKQNMEMLMGDTIIAVLLSDRKLGPKVLGITADGRIEEFISGHSLHPDEMRNPLVSAKIASRMAEFHRYDMPLAKEPNFIFDTLRKWRVAMDQHDLTMLHVAREHFVPSSSDNGSGSGCDATKSSIGDLHFIDIDAECNWLKRQFDNHADFVVAFCHNDLQIGNVMLTGGNNLKNVTNGSEPRDCDCELDVQFIDFEYCAYNYRAFDIGNHFSEWVFDYLEPNPPFFTFDETKYPSTEERRNFFSAYLGEQRDSKDAEQHYDLLEVEALYGAALANFFWSVWAVRQVKYSTINFGFLKFAEYRLTQYFRHKKSILQLSERVKQVERA